MGASPGGDRRDWLERIVAVCRGIEHDWAARRDADRYGPLLEDVKDVRRRVEAELGERGAGARSDRESRIAQNELLFRKVNDRIDELTGDWDQAFMTAVCECGQADCFAPIEFRIADYRSIRDARHFLVRPGHEIPDVERVVGRFDGYFVVEKPAAAEELAGGGTG